MKKTIILGAAISGLLALVGPARAQIIYQDNFSQLTSNLAGSVPDTADANGNQWAEAQLGRFPPYADNILVNSSGVASSNGMVADTTSYDILAVNDSSADNIGNGAALGGESFTISIVGTPGAEGTSIGLALFSGWGMWENVELGPTSATYTYNNGAKTGTFSLGTTITSPVTLSMSYSTATGLITYSYNSTVIGTDTPIFAPASQNANNPPAFVGFGFDDPTPGNAYVPSSATVNSFTLTGPISSVPEPSTIWSFVLGLSGLVGFRMKRRSNLG